MAPAREVIELDPDPGHPVETVDFNSVALLSAWTKRQRETITLKNTFVEFASNVTIFATEAVSLIIILVHGFWFQKEYYDTETIWSIGLWTVAVFLSTFVKFFDDSCIRRDKSIWARIRRVIVNLLLPLKPFRYWSALKHRVKKQNILGRRVMYGETTTRIQVESIMRVNEFELIDARYELFEAYLQAIPMALLQNYFLFSENQIFHLCDYRDVARLFIVVFHLISVARASAAFDYKKQQYELSLHTFGHLQCRGRYPMPEFQLDKWSHRFNTACHFMSILSRFYLISFFMAIHWALGITCTILLFTSNWLLYHLFPSVRSTVENLPVGVSLSLSYLVDRWINTFTAKETRFNELSRKLNRFFMRGRYPVVLTQIVTFSISFLVTYMVTRVVGGHFLDLAHRSLTTIETNSVVNASICNVTGKWSENIGVFHYISDFLASCQHNLNKRFGTFNDFYNIIHFHWLFLYIHCLFAFVYNFYVSQFELQNDDYPVVLAIKFVKILFLKIFLENPSEGRPQLLLARRFLFLISTNLKTFDRLVRGSRDNDIPGDPGTKSRWLDKTVRLHLDQTSERGNMIVPNWSNSPFAQELELLLGIIQADPFGKRSFAYCVNNLDLTLLEEMTSNRIENLFELFCVSKSEMGSVLEGSVDS